MRPYYVCVLQCVALGLPTAVGKRKTKWNLSQVNKTIATYQTGHLTILDPHNLKIGKFYFIQDHRATNFKALKW